MSDKKNIKTAQSGVDVVTFGCRLNIYESEVMRHHAEDAGMKDAIIFNTCAVTKQAEREARRAIRKARRENPDAKIIVTGCAAQIDPDGFAAMSEIDQIIGNDLKLEAESWHSSATERMKVNDIMATRETAGHLISGFDDHARAFVQVQNGCDHRCTFCIIPYGRGNSRSVPIGEIVKQVRLLVEKGYKEVVLTGVDVTSYGADLPGKPRLGQMMRRLLALVPELPRLRLSSLDPVEIDDDIWRLFENEPRLMPHLHLSLQAGDDMVLKRMKRRHLRDDVIAVCKKARDLRPDIVFGADIIAGFPTETEEMFENTRRIVTECDLTYLHVFPYSEREGTPAARMPQVYPPLRKERAKILRDLGNEQVRRRCEEALHTEVDVLVEKNNTGHTPHFLPVRFDENIAQGTVVRAKLIDIQNNMMTGQVI